MKCKQPELRIQNQVVQIKMEIWLDETGMLVE